MSDKTTTLFDPAKLPERDADGYTFHSDLEQFLDGAESEDDMVLASERLRAAGWEWHYDALEHDDRPEAQEARNEYFDDGMGVTKWQPATPEGEGWQLVAIYDTEDGAYAMHVRPQGQQS